MNSRVAGQFSHAIPLCKKDNTNTNNSKGSSYYVVGWKIINIDNVYTFVFILLIPLLER